MGFSETASDGNGERGAKSVGGYLASRGSGGFPVGLMTGPAGHCRKGQR